MPKRQDIHRIMVIGSGPIVIGQAAEFDYSGTQACKTLRQEGYEVVLVNSNPATIMTDAATAESIYIEPITLDYVTRIIEKERPQGLLASLGGQTGLNMALELARSGVLERYNVELLGTPLEAIEKSEDREKFKATMQLIGEKVPHSTIVHTLPDALAFAEQAGYPIIIRPAYTLGGTGGGVATDEAAFREIVTRGLKASIIHQVLLEQSVLGWREIEYEVMRDANDECIIVCTMENIDPCGIHTGDSMVVAPILTLNEREQNELRAASINIIRTLGISGGCNIQYASDPETGEYVVIEVNPRVSRSSALASKATGYPIARVSTQIAVGYTLGEIVNKATGVHYANREPKPDYVVCKVPRWPFDKFVTANRKLGTQMKATGEVMSIGNNFEEALLKAIDSLDVHLNYHLGMERMKSWTDEDIRESLASADDERVFVISEALRRGMSVEEVMDITKISRFFVAGLEHIVTLGKALKGHTRETLPPELLRECKRFGFGDTYIAQFTDASAEEITEMRGSLRPGYCSIDAHAGLKGVTPYFYSTYEAPYKEIPPAKGRRVAVLGSGPIRIGQGIEFDYCCVHAVQALKRKGVESVIINSNPETVSTDFDTADKLYFEPLTVECVLDILKCEKPDGVVVQFGGQTSINLAAALAAHGVNILGTAVEDIDAAEDRDRFLRLLESLSIPSPAGGAACDEQGALAIAGRLGYPLIVRPSYVLGGRGMEVVYSDDSLKAYMSAAVDIHADKPVLIDRYIPGKEVEVDGIADGKDVIVAGIMEHIERAGVHSGDSIAVYPAQSLSQETKNTLIDYSIRIAKALRIKGLFNIQFVLDERERVYVLEVNPRASRTVPILSKVTKLPMVDIATGIMLGETIEGMGYEGGLYPESELITVKAPVFSFSKLTTVDTYLCPEMKSTGEVMGISTTYRGALAKALLSSGMKLPQPGSMLLFSIADRDLEHGFKYAKRFEALGYRIAATAGTSAYFAAHGLEARLTPRANLLETLKGEDVALVINTPTLGSDKHRLGFMLRRTAMEFSVPCVTSLDTVGALLHILEGQEQTFDLIPLHEYR